MSTQTDNVAELPNTRIVTATAELNQVVDDIRDAEDAPEVPPPAAQKERHCAFIP